MKREHQVTGHIAAIVTCLIWGNNICVDKGITTRFWTGRFIVFTIFTWIFYIVVDAAKEVKN